MKTKKITRLAIFFTAKTPILAIAVTLVILASVSLLANNTYLYEYSNSNEHLHFKSESEIFIELGKNEYFSTTQIPDQIIWYSSSYSMNYISKLLLVTDYSCLYQVDFQDFKNEFTNDSTSAYDVTILYKNKEISFLEKVLKNEK